MRFKEFGNGILIPLNNEELRIFRKIKNPSGLRAEALEEHEIELARRMVSRGVLNRKHIDGATCYCRNDNNLE